MMRPPILQVALFRDHASDDTEHERSRLAMLLLLEWLAQYDRLWIRTYGAPKIYESGVKYIHKTGKEASCWQGIETCVLKKTGDCKDFAAWRVAELREQGIDCHPAILWRKIGDAYRFHAIVEFEDMTQEDPSVLLGMKAPVGYQNGSILSGALVTYSKGRNMNPDSVARAIMAGLMSSDPGTQQKAMSSVRKLQACSDDPDCARALAAVKRQAAALRKQIKTRMNGPTTLSGLIKKGFRWTLGNLYHAGVRGANAAHARDMKKDGAIMIGSDDILGSEEILGAIKAPPTPGHRAFPAIKKKAQAAIANAMKTKSKAASALAKAHSQAAKTMGKQTVMPASNDPRNAIVKFFSNAVTVNGKPLSPMPTIQRGSPLAKTANQASSDFLNELKSIGIHGLGEEIRGEEIVGELEEILGELRGAGGVYELLGDYEIVGDALTDTLNALTQQINQLQQTIQDLTAQDGNVQQLLLQLQNANPGGFGGALSQANQIAQIQVAQQDANLQNSIAGASAQIDGLNASIQQINDELNNLSQQQAAYQAGVAQVQAYQSQLQPMPMLTTPPPMPVSPSAPDMSSYAQPQPDYSGYSYSTPDYSSYAQSDYSSYDDSSQYVDDSSSMDDEPDLMNGMGEEILGVVDETSRQAMKVASDATPVLAIGAAFIPGVGPLLAPLTPEIIKFSNEQITKAEGGDPQAAGQIADAKAKAKAGDPDALNQIDALNRVHKARKLVKAAQGKPFKNSLSNWYNAGVSGADAVS